MNYIEALQALVDGKKIRHKSWGKDAYRFIGADDKLYSDIEAQTSFMIYNKNEILSDSWEIYQTEEERLITDGKRWKILRACEMCGCENCERKQEELYKFCQRRIGSFDEILIRVSDDEVNSIYNLLKIKGEIDA